MSHVHLYGLVDDIGFSSKPPFGIGQQYLTAWQPEHEEGLIEIIRPRDFVLGDNHMPLPCVNAYVTRPCIAGRSSQSSQTPSSLTLTSFHNIPFTILDTSSSTCSSCECDSQLFRTDYSPSGTTRTALILIHNAHENTDRPESEVRSALHITHSTPEDTCSKAPRLKI